jgi:hypothetical protein
LGIIYDLMPDGRRSVDLAYRDIKNPIANALDVPHEISPPPAWTGLLLGTPPISNNSSIYRIYVANREDLNDR